MVLVEPGSGHVANLSNDIAPNFLGKLKDWRLGGRVKQESKEGLILTLSIYIVGGGGRGKGES